MNFSRKKYLLAESAHNNLDEAAIKNELRKAKDRTIVQIDSSSPNIEFIRAVYVIKKNGTAYYIPCFCKSRDYTQHFYEVDKAFTDMQIDEVMEKIKMLENIKPDYATEKKEVALKKVVEEQYRDK